MEKIFDEIELDLNGGDELQVWEMNPTKPVIDLMREGIRIGCYFPAVDVVKI